MRLAKAMRSEPSQRPFGRRAGRDDQARRGTGRKPVPFRQRRTRCRKARPDPRARSAAGAEGRRTQGAVLFGYFLLLRASCPTPFGPASLFARAPGAVVGKQEKVTRRPKDVETAFHSRSRHHDPGCRTCTSKDNFNTAMRSEPSQRPVGSRAGRDDQARRGTGRKPVPFRQRRTRCRKARPDPRARSANGAEGRRTQGGLLLATFLGQTRKVARRPKDVEIAFCRQQKCAPTRAPLRRRKAKTLDDQHSPLKSASSLRWMTVRLCRACARRPDK